MKPRNSIGRSIQSRLRLAALLSAALWSSPGFAARGVAMAAEGEFRSDLACRELPEALEQLRAEGLRLAYSDGLLSRSMLVREPPPASEPESTLEALVSAHGLAIERMSDGVLSVVPGESLAASDLRRLRRNSGPLLQLSTIASVVPEWAVLDSDDAAASGRVVVTRLPIPELGSLDLPLGIERSDHLLLDLSARFLPTEDNGFRLERAIVDATSRAPRARVALRGTSEQIEGLVDVELAPYVDGYVALDREVFVPSSDPTATAWWLIEQDSRPPLEILLDASSRGVSLVVFAPRSGSATAPVSPRDEELIDALRATSAGLLERQPRFVGGRGKWSRVLLEPSSGRYYLVVIRLDSGSSIPGEALDFRLEPMAEARALLPLGASIGVDFDGARTAVHLGSDSHWLIELTPDARPDPFGLATVSDEVLVDPYEVVVRNQAFRERESRKVMSLEVTEWATIVPLWRDGRQARWEHRIFQRRGLRDEFLHLNLWLDGVRQPRNKLWKGVLSRPIDRIEQEPLQLEMRDSYTYRFLGSEDLDGYPTWKIGFRPRAEGRLVEGTVWIDRETGAHRRIRSAHKALDPGIVAGEYTTDFGWIADAGNCYWDWQLRRGVQSIDYLDLTGSQQIEYRREDFDFNRAGVHDRLREAHESDVLIHVATPPNGHRWLLGEGERRGRRGDVQYSPRVVQEQSTPSDAVGLDPMSDEAAPGRSSGPALSSLSALRSVLAGSGAFSGRTRVTMGITGGSGGTETDVDLGFNFTDFDLFGSGTEGAEARGSKPWYFRVGGFEDDGLVSLTRPEIFGSSCSWTTSMDLYIDPQEYFLFTVRDTGLGDENQFANLSLDVREVTLRTGLSRSLGHGWMGRFTYALTELSIDRRSGTDSAFVLPLDTSEHRLGFQAQFGGRAVWLEAEAELGRRDDWQRWGLDQRQEERSSWFRLGGRATWAHQFTASQMLSLTGGVFVGRDTDRFSRYRQFEVDARVPGYSSSIGFDEMVHAAVAYNFRLGPLPLRFRVDLAELGFSDDSVDPFQPDQELAGVQLQLNLHGPFRTDLLFGVGRGVHAEPSRGEEETFVWGFFSRRFGGG